ECPGGGPSGGHRCVHVAPVAPRGRQLAATPTTRGPNGVGPRGRTWANGDVVVPGAGELDQGELAPLSLAEARFGPLGGDFAREGGIKESLAASCPWANSSSPP